MAGNGESNGPPAVEPVGRGRAAAEAPAIDAAPAGTQRVLRADARRNRDRLIATAREVLAARGAEASLDDIARRAGVGSGTLYRHFPTRGALVEAVYRDGVETLCATGEDLLRTRPPADALYEWLRAFVDFVSQKRGLAGSLLASIDTTALFADTHAMIAAVGGALLERAKAAGEIRVETQLMDLVKFANAVALACERSPDEGLADRLLRLAFDGLLPRSADTPPPTAGPVSPPPADRS